MNDNNDVITSVNSNISDVTFDTDSLEDITKIYQNVHESFLEIEDLIKLLSKPNYCGLFGTRLTDFNNSLRKYEEEIKEKINNYDSLIDSVFNIERNYTNEINDLVIPKGQ